MTWVIDDLDWNWGLNAVYQDPATYDGVDKHEKPYAGLLKNTQLDFHDIDDEKSQSKFKYFLSSKLFLDFHIHV